MLKINKERLVMQSVSGKIHHPERTSMSYALDVDGELHIFPATGGITYNKKVGDNAFDLEGDHVEPGVSVNNSSQSESSSLLTLSCIGNYARMISGDAKGAIGYVVGKHGGIDNVVVQFKDEEQEKMAPGDGVLIKAYGQGLKLLNYPDICVMNISPDLLEKIEISQDGGKLIFPVRAIVPKGLMGSGLGESNAYKGDTDIITQDRQVIKKYGLDKLCFGDFVLVEDYYCQFGTTNVTGAVTVGVIVHSDCVKNGHGPGVTAILTCRKSMIKASIGGKCNIVDYLTL